MNFSSCHSAGSLHGLQRLIIFMLVFVALVPYVFFVAHNLQLLIFSNFVSFVCIIYDSPRTRCMNIFLMCISLGFLVRRYHFGMTSCTADLKPLLGAYLYWQLHVHWHRAVLCCASVQGLFQITFWAWCLTVLRKSAVWVVLLSNTHYSFFWMYTTLCDLILLSTLFRTEYMRNSFLCKYTPWWKDRVCLRLDKFF